MSDKSKIEWTDATWNPVTGCDEVSPGCDNCYAKTFAERWRGTPGHYYERGFDVQLRPDKLDEPLRWRRRRKVFVNSMSDLYHDQVPDEYIGAVFDVMARAPQHTFQILTKRHGRMRSLLTRWAAGQDRYVAQYYPDGRPVAPGRSGHIRIVGEYEPLPNAWLGVSVEDQKWAKIRLDALAETPAAVRFVSCEPLLGPVLLCRCDGAAYEVQRHPFLVEPGCPLHGDRRIDWVIVGGESGHGARPMHPDWARSLRDQCVAAGVPFFFKQWGGWAPAEPGGWYSRTTWLTRDGEQYSPVEHRRTDADAYLYAPRSKDLRELDGRTWDEYPKEVPGRA